MSAYRVRIIDNLSDWEQIRGPWDEILVKSTSNNVFLTWEWMHSWAECFLNDQRELFIVVVYDGDAIVGIAPWYIHKISKGICSIRQIEFIGTPEAGSDYLDVPMKKGREKEVTCFLYDFLLGEAAASWDRLRLHDIPANSLFLLHFLHKVREQGKYVHVSESSFCPVVELGSSEEEFFSGLTSNRRELFRRHLKILSKQDAFEHLTFSTGGTEKPIQDFFSLYREKTGRPGDDLQCLISKFDEKKRNASLQIDFLSAGGRYIGGLLHICYQDTLYMYLMAIDKSYNPKVSIGSLLVGLSITNAIQSGATCYDFLKGAEEYKFHWANNGRRSSSIIFSQRNLSPICFTIAEIAKSVGKLILR